MPSYSETRRLAEQAQQELDVETQTRKQAQQQLNNAIPQLLAMGLTEEQVARALGLSVDEVRWR